MITISALKEIIDWAKILIVRRAGSFQRNTVLRNLYLMILYEIASRMVYYIQPVFTFDYL